MNKETKKISFKETKVVKFLEKFPEIVVGPLMFLWVFILIVIATNGLQEILPGGQNAVSIGTLQIKWYAIFILTGIIFAAIFAYHEFPKIGISRNDLTDMILVMVPVSILGARLYYVIFDPVKGNYQNFWDVINPTNGGLAIHGAIIVAFVGAIVFSKIKKIKFWHLFDIIVIGFLLGQVIGRWGNFINQEAYGPIVENSWIFDKLVPNFVKKNMIIGGNYHHPTFLYESFLNFVVMVALLVVRRFRLLKVGDGLPIYLIAYGLIRGLAIEPLRQDQLEIFGEPVNIWFSLILFAGLGIILLVLKYVLFKDLPYYYDLSINENLYIKGVEGREYRRRLKEEKQNQKKLQDNKQTEDDNDV